MGRAPRSRDETSAERADRNWVDLLQEFRVMQTGVQILGGFLLTLPFQSVFGDLDSYQRRLYLALVLLAAATTTLLLAPIAVHRHVFRQLRKPLLVSVGHRTAQTALVLIALLMTGIATLVFDVVAGRRAGLVVGAVMLTLALGCLVLVPLAIGHRGRRP